MELYKKYRPQKTSEIVGQTEAIKVLDNFIRTKTVPHVIMFVGPSGSGKTTAARILGRAIGCTGHDVTEIDTAAVEAMECVRELKKKLPYPSLSGGNRMYILDELQSFSRARFAQEVLLKMLEETPKHVYFAICTTDPSKIIQTVRKRCSIIRMQPVDNAGLKTMLKRVVDSEKARVSDKVIAKIIDITTEGNVREALVWLEQIIRFDSEAEQLSALAGDKVKAAAFDLVKALMPFSGRPSWSDAAKVLQSAENESPETFRRILLATARTYLLKGDKMSPQAALVIQCFRDPIFDDTKAGHAILAACAWDVVQTSPKK